MAAHRLLSGDRTAKSGPIMADEKQTSSDVNTISLVGVKAARVKSSSYHRNCGRRRKISYLRCNTGDIKRARKWISGDERGRLLEECFAVFVGLRSVADANWTDGLAETYRRYLRNARVMLFSRH